MESRSWPVRGPGTIVKFARPVLVLFGLCGLLIMGLARTATAAGPDRGSLPAILAQPAPSGTGPGPDRAGFDARWHDGRAELDGYRLTIERYGRPRLGRAVLIYVTEPFSQSKHVKVDDPAKNPADTFEAFKLNLVRHFQTGIYDYSTMVSLFTRASDFTTVKVSFTSAEWCGHVYEELNFDKDHLAGKFFSYFENESSEAALAVPAGGIEEDALFILLRGLRQEFMAPEEKRTVPFLASPFYRRLTHQALAWSKATIERLSDPQSVHVPAGHFMTREYVVRPEDGREGHFFIERDEPYRVVYWTWTPAPAAGKGSSRFPGGTDRGELTGSIREQYWNLHEDRDEKYLESLGLRPARGTSAPGPQSDR